MRLLLRGGVPMRGRGRGQRRLVPGGAGLRAGGEVLQAGRRLGPAGDQRLLVSGPHGPQSEDRRPGRRGGRPAGRDLFSVRRRPEFHGVPQQPGTPGTKAGGQATGAAAPADGGGADGHALPLPPGPGALGQGGAGWLALRPYQRGGVSGPGRLPAACAPPAGAGVQAGGSHGPCRTVAAGRRAGQPVGHELPGPHQVRRRRPGGSQGPVGAGRRLELPHRPTQPGSAALRP